MKNSLNRSSALSELWVGRHYDASDFILSSWQRGDSAVPLLVVRFVLSTISILVMICAVIGNPKPYWLIYATNWGLLLLSLTMVSALKVSWMARRNRLCYESSELPWYVSMYWLLTNINVTISILITISYWKILYDNTVTKTALAIGLEISTHALNCGISLCELVLSRTPVNVIHIYQPVCVELLYAVFSVIYHFAKGTDLHGNPYIYSVIDWKETHRTAFLFGMSLLLILVIYVILWIVVKARDKVSEDKIRTTSQDFPLAPSPLTPEQNV